MGKFSDLKNENRIQQCQTVFAHEISQKEPVVQFWSKATCKTACSGLGQTLAQVEARLPMSTLSYAESGSFLPMKTVSGQQCQKLL